jgi:hypothetical protein
MAKKLYKEAVWPYREIQDLDVLCVLQWIQESCDVCHVHILTLTPALTHNIQ